MICNVQFQCKMSYLDLQTAFFPSHIFFFGRVYVYSVCFSYAHLPEKNADLCPDGWVFIFSPMYLLSFPKKVPSEFSLENVQWKLR